MIDFSVSREKQNQQSSDSDDQIDVELTPTPAKKVDYKLLYTAKNRQQHSPNFTKVLSEITANLVDYGMLSYNLLRCDSGLLIF